MFYVHLTIHQNKGPFTNHVDTFCPFFRPPLSPLWTCMDKMLNPPPPPVDVHGTDIKTYKTPHSHFSFFIEHLKEKEKKHLKNELHCNSCSSIA